MRKLKRVLGFKSYEALIINFVNTVKEKEYPKLTPAVVMNGTVPVILTGKPGTEVSTP